MAAIHEYKAAPKHRWRRTPITKRGYYRQEERPTDRPFVFLSCFQSFLLLPVVLCLVQKLNGRDAKCEGRFVSCTSAIKIHMLWTFDFWRARIPNFPPKWVFFSGSFLTPSLRLIGRKRRIYRDRLVAKDESIDLNYQSPWWRDTTRKSVPKCDIFHFVRQFR